MSTTAGRLWSRFFISKRTRMIRGGFVPLLSNILTIAGVVFALELLVVLFGIHDIFIPLGSEALSFLTRVF